MAIRLESFSKEEMEILQVFARDNMQDTNSATNGDSLRMGLTLKVYKQLGDDVYQENKALIQEKIDSIHRKLASVFDRK